MQEPVAEQGTVRVCAYCQKEEVWMFSGKKLRDGSKVYVDARGLRWAGRRCPTCERSRVYAAVRCDSFEREIILKQFEQNGFQVESRTLPFKVSKDGQTYTVGVKRAYTQGGKIVLETPVEAGHDLVALVFESVRICSTDQLSRMGPNIGIYQDSPAAEQ